jgi:hypothetical protein
MTLDAYTRLSGTTSAGQNIANTTTAGVYSTHWLDLDAGGALRTKRDLRDIFGLFWTTGTLDSATNNATIDIELVMCPTVTPGTPTFTTTGDTDISTANDTITEPSHGLPNGTRLTVVSSGAYPTGLATATNYYVVQATTDTFKVSVTPGGTPVDITATAAVTLTWTWYAEVVGAASKIGLERLVANVSQVQLCINPLLLGPGNGVPVHRYLFGRYTPSATLGAAAQPVFMDLQRGAPMANFPINPSNYVTP